MQCWRCGDHVASFRQPPQHQQLQLQPPPKPQNPTDPLSSSETHPNIPTPTSPPGVVTPTSGDAHVNGLSLEHVHKRTPGEVGWAGQQPMLWPDLTVVEHMHMHALWKGLTWQEAEKEAEDALA